MTWQAVRRDAQRTLARFSNLSGRQIVRQYLRALRLQFNGRTSVPPVEASQSDALRPNRRIVVSLTTIPGRIHSLTPTLLSLLDQDMPADRLVLALPFESRRDEVQYPNPSTLHLPQGFDVLRCEDLGPATKILPALEAEPEALVIAVDDDVIYPRDFITTLASAYVRAPQTCIGLRGVCINRTIPFVDQQHIMCSGVVLDTPVDIVFGTWGYMVPAWLCDQSMHDFSAYPDEVRWVDDVYISGHLARLGIERRVATSSSFPVESLSALRHGLSSGINRSGENDKTAIDCFDAYW